MGRQGAPVFRGGCGQISPSAPLVAAMADDREQFAPVEMSDGAMRPWYLRDEDRRRRFVYGVGAVAFALFGLVVSVLLSSVNGGIQALVGQNRQASGTTQGIPDTLQRHHIVSWCPCGRTLRAGGIYDYNGNPPYKLPAEAQTCAGCFDNYAWELPGYGGTASHFPKTDYDPSEANPSVRSFIYQMKHNLTDEVIVDKCGWRKEGSAYYAYGQEEIDVRMCVIEEFLNHMAKQGWYFMLESWYAQQKDIIILVKHN